MRNADQTLLGTNLYDVYPLLEIEGFDLESRMGFNPLVSATWTAAVDQLATQGQITLFRGDHTGPLGLSPFLRAAGPVAYRPQAGRHFALRTATVAKGSAPAFYETVFDGRIDGADGAFGSSETQLTCRDMMGCFLNRTIEPPAPPETPDGKNGFLVASAPLGSHLNAVRSAAYPDSSASVLEQRLAATPIVGLGTPDWTVVDTWVQYGGNVAEQLHQAVLQRGWAFHYRYTPLLPSAFVYYDPQREWSGANYIVQPDEVIRALRCTINDQDVTNAWDLIWGRGAARTRTRLVDDTSIATYGRRYGSYPDPQTGQIDTQPEADRLIAAMLADTKDPVVELDYERLYFWPVELADKHYMVANLSTTDIALDLAVVGYTHTLTPKSMRSVIRCRGTAVAANRRWRRILEPPVLIALDPPQGIAREGTIAVQVDDLTPPA